MPAIIQPSPITVPRVGGSYADPMSGRMIRRIASNAHTEYSTVCPFSENNRWALVIAGDRQDHFALVDLEAYALKDLPLLASSEPRWSRIEDILYFHGPACGLGSNELGTLNVATGEVRSMQKFLEPITFGCGEGDQWGDLLPIVQGGHISAFDLMRGSQSAALDATGKPLDAVYVCGENIIVSWSESGTERFQGIELFDLNMNFIRQLVRADGHHDVGVLDGRTVMCWTNSNENPVTVQTFPNGIIRVDMDGKQTGLVSLPWIEAVHVSAPENAEWVLVETYQKPDYDWAAFSNEILQVWTDGSRIERLCHTRATVREYSNQPKVSVSRDGRIAFFTSNMAGQDDVYLLEIPAASPGHPKTADSLTLEQRVSELEAWRKSKGE